MPTTESRGIDYGRGQVNIDKENGIRFGVIPFHALDEWAHEGFEADYGPPTCPECGNECVDLDNEEVPEYLDELVAYTEENRTHLYRRGAILIGYEVDDKFVPAEEFEATRWTWDGECCWDYACANCRKVLGSDLVFGDEPVGHYLDDGEYKATQGGDDCDVFVLQSPYYTHAQFCSPCAPGACFLLNPCEGGPKAYCFGHQWFDGDKAPYPVFSVATGEPVLPEESNE